MHTRTASSTTQHFGSVKQDLAFRPEGLWQQYCLKTETPPYIMIDSSLSQEEALETCWLEYVKQNGKLGANDLQVGICKWGFTCCVELARGASGEQKSCLWQQRGVSPELTAVLLFILQVRQRKNSSHAWPPHHYFHSQPLQCIHISPWDDTVVPSSSSEVRSSKLK